MRRRIYFMLPDRASARRTMDELLLQRIEERYIHFIARPDVSMEGLHEANVLHTTDLVHGAKLGALIGVAAGCVGGAVIQWLFVKDANYQIVTVIGMAAFGGLFGAWVASMVGSAVPNTQLRQFEREIAQGQILLMVDLPALRVREIEQLLQTAHPEARFEGEEGQIPAFH